MNKRQESALKTRQKLIDTADKLIREYGFNRLCVEDITREAGVAKETFYVYFKHKEDIVYELCKILADQIEEHVEQLKNTSVLNKLSSFFDYYALEVQKYGINIIREWIKGIVDLNTDHESIGSIKWNLDYKLIKKILNTAVKQNELKKNTPVELISKLLLAQAYGLFTCWCMTDGKFKPTSWTPKFSKFQLESLLKDYLT